MVDERLLAEATMILGEKTYSGTVERALTEIVRHHKASKIFDLQGSGLWQGDLAEMRDDAPRPATKRAKRR